MASSVIRSAPISRIPVKLPMKPSELERTTSAPSKLQRLQAQYQQKLLQDKEDKLLGRLRASQQDALLRVAARNGVVRNFFTERRQVVDAWGYATGPTEYAKMRTSPAAAGKPPIRPRQNSGGIGRDRAKPLVPINRCKSDGDEVRENNVYKVHALDQVRHNPQPPVRQKPNHVRPHPRSGSGGTSRSPNTVPVHKTEKLTDFQRWQMNQDKARTDRLARFQQRQPPSHEPQQTFDVPTDDIVERNSPVKEKPNFQQWKAQINKMNNRNNQNVPRSAPEPKPNPVHRKAKARRSPKLAEIRAQPAVDQMSECSTARDSPDSPLASQRSRVEDDLLERKQRELLTMIERQRSELARMQQKRVEEDRQAAEDAAEEQRRAAAQQERNRRLKEAEDRKKQKEAEAAAAAAAAVVQEERYSPIKSHRSVPRSPVSSRKQVVKTPQENKKFNNSPPPEKVFPKSPKKIIPMKQRKPPPSPPPPPEKDEYPRDNNVDFYARAAADDGASENMNLRECSICGRNFAEDRLAKHINVCSKAGQKKRKTFDPVKMRTAGTEQAQYVKHIKNEPPAQKKKGNWKAKHEEFIRNIRYAKKVTELEAKGGDLSSLPPPPPSENPDYKQCPHCKRRFNPDAAERHIPRCQNLKTKPILRRGR